MVGLYRRAINDRPYYIIDTLFDKRQFIGQNGAWKHFHAPYVFI